MSFHPASRTSSSSRSPDFDSPNDRFGYPFGLIIYYSWNFLATIILVNVLIALFGSAYSDVEENATDEYLAFFAHKTIDLSKSSLLVSEIALMISPST
jgi:hypothetical protein